MKLPPIDIFKDKYGPLRLVLAPMSGITDSVFRVLMREMGADCVISELVSVEGLVRKSANSLMLLKFLSMERPVGIQLFGLRKEAFIESAKMVEDSGADFVDLNFGCPVKKVVVKGAGAALLKNPNVISGIIEGVKKNVSIPVTLKIRTGWDNESINVKEVVKIASDSGASWVTIHGRTRSDLYSGKANWEIIKEVSDMNLINVIGNGDIFSASDGIEKIEKGYSNAIMIGRGVLRNPWIFEEIKGRELKKDLLALFGRLFELASNYDNEKKALMAIKKFVSYFSKGEIGSSNFRKILFSIKNIFELKNFCFEYFSSYPPSRFFPEVLNDNEKINCRPFFQQFLYSGM